MTQSESNTKYSGTAFAAYLAVTAVPLVVSAARHTASPAIVAGHVLLLGAAFWVARNPAPRWTLWLPLLAIPFLYVELPSLMPVFGEGLHDATVQRWEIALFGESPAGTLAGRFPSLLLSEVLHAGYLSYYLLIYLPPLIAWLRHQEVAFDEAVFAVTVTFLVSCAVFVVWPVAGPRYMWPAPANIPHGPIRSLALAILEAGSSRGAAFPSSHVAIAVAQTAVALRRQPRIGVACGVLTTLLGVGAVYGGFHYAVDAIAGATLGVLVASLVRHRRAAPV